MNGELEDLNGVKRINLREDVEWSNTWISKANLDFPRCLLIGDSVTRDIRSTLEKLVADWFAVDFFGGSYDMDDDLFWNHLFCFFKSGYKYKLIILNYGFHHGKSIIKEKERNRFKSNYRKLLRLCLQNSLYVAFMSGTSWYKECIDYIKYEEEIILKNNILLNLARNNHCAFFDLHKAMGNMPYRYIDHVHFERKANTFISKKIIIELFARLFNAEWTNYRKEKETNIYKQYPELAISKEIYIYGNGEKGHFLYFLLKTYVPNLKLIGWCLSEKCEAKYLDIPIFLVNSLPSNNLIVIPSGIYEKEMMENAKKHGHNNLLIFSIK